MSDPARPDDALLSPPDDAVRPETPASGGKADAAPEEAATAESTPVAPKKKAKKPERRPRIFMLGWEYPPLISGGLGTACHGLTKALSDKRVDVTFVLPRPTNLAAAAEAARTPDDVPHDTTDDTTDDTSDDRGPTLETIGEERVEFFDAPENVKIETVAVGGFGPYANPADRQDNPNAEAAVGAERYPDRQTLPFIRQVIHRQPQPIEPGESVPSFPGRYAGDMFAEVRKYADLAVELAEKKAEAGVKFDVVHAHDWMTYPAGLAVAAKLDIPLVVHVHSTEYDRSGDGADPRIAEIERRGVHAARRVIAVSHYTRSVIAHRYGLEAERVDVIHNGIDVPDDLAPPTAAQSFRIGRDEKIVLFLGRITMQKGPEYFIEAAKKVLDVMPDVRFVMAGNGDRLPPILQLAVDAGIGNRVLFTGFLRGSDVEAVFKLADLYVMPSVSEPFGIAPLEAMSHDVPVIISKTSGVSEVLKHALKVDFWDTDEMANKIVAVLKHPSLAGTLRREGALEVRSMRWTDAADRCKAVYAELTTAPPAEDASRFAQA